MSALSMVLTGDDSVGWTWSVLVDDVELWRTAPLARGDLASALFSIQRDRSRTNPSFSAISDDDLLFLLDGFFFGALHEALRASAEEQTWARHLVSPALPAVVCSRMYLVGSGEGKERLLVRQAAGRRSFVIAEGNFDSELAAVRKRLDETP